MDWWWCASCALYVPGTIRFPVNIDIQEEDVAFQLSINGELNVMDTVEMTVEVACHVLWGQITKVSSTHLKQQSGLWLALFSDSSSKSMKKLSVTGDRVDHMGTLSVCS
jgi:hypothetical protein